jgi:hypothetical protein
MRVTPSDAITMHNESIDACYFRAIARYHRAGLIVGVLIPRERKYRLNEYVVFSTPTLFQQPHALRFKIVRITATDLSQSHNVVYMLCA